MWPSQNTWTLNSLFFKFKSQFFYNIYWKQNPISNWPINGSLHVKNADVKFKCENHLKIKQEFLLGSTTISYFGLSRERPFFCFILVFSESKEWGQNLYEVAFALKLKFIYSEKATNINSIKKSSEISSNFVAFSEFNNFTAVAVLKYALQKNLHFKLKLWGKKILKMGIA